jgi:hypothetical protein
MMLFRPTGLIPERRRKREIDEGQGRVLLDESLHESPEPGEPGGGAKH